jgi:GTPase SAR1 family protein
MMSKKIVLVGPAGTGKTSIKKTFFEKCSPITLLENPLKPSRGINTSNYSLLDSELGIFDLAGQENDLWLSDSNQSVFENSNIIICVFDIHNSVESIIQFLLSIYYIQQALNLESCYIVTFLHKVELVSNSYIEQKIKTINNFVKTHHPMATHFEIYKTSITQYYYYNTFRILSNLLKLILSHEEKFDQINQLDDIRSQYRLFFDGIDSKQIWMDDLFSKLNYSEDNIRTYIKELQKKGFINNIEGLNAFALSDSAYFYKFGFEQQRKKGGKFDENLAFETFYFFFFLNDSTA